MEPLYKCDFYLKLFVERELNMCGNCGEIFCVKCVENPPVFYTVFGGENIYYCTETCCVEHKKDIQPPVYLPMEST
jgi:hypothetical protein